MRAPLAFARRSGISRAPFRRVSLVQPSAVWGRGIEMASGEYRVRAWRETGRLTPWFCMTRVKTWVPAAMPLGILALKRRSLPQGSLSRGDCQRISPDAATSRISPGVPFWPVSRREKGVHRPPGTATGNRLRRFLPPRRTWPPLSGPVCRRRSILSSQARKSGSICLRTCR